MFATWILCLFLLMIAPYLTLEAGVLRNQPSQAFRAQSGRLICPFLHSFLHKQSPNDFKTVRALLYAFVKLHLPFRGG